MPHDAMNSGAEHFEPLEAHHEPESLDAMFHEQSEEIILREQPEADEVEHAREVERLTELLEQSHRFLHMAENEDQPHAELTDFQRDEVVQLAQEIRAVNAMDWKLIDSGQHYRAKRDDGTSVTVPGNYFHSKKHALDLSEVQVNAKEGYTIHDSLLRIIGKTYDTQGKRIIEKEDENG